MARKLSERQRGILTYIGSYVEDRGYPPSIREIGDHVGISSTSVVDYNLRALERDGLIRRDREVSRGLEVVGGSGRPTRHTAPRMVRVPVIGRIAAGLPIEAVEDETDVLEFTPGSVPEGCFALRVRGTSMVDDHIDDGDIVVVRPQSHAENGEIVVAVVADERANDGATLKRFYREGANVRLQPRNPEMEPIIVPARSVQIKGKVIKLVRDL